MSGSAKLRASLYATLSGGLKIVGIYGLVNQEESQAWLLFGSAVVDLAFFNVPGIKEKITRRKSREHRGR
jgi:hypothetical protein